MFTMLVNEGTNNCFVYQDFPEITIRELIKGLCDYDLNSPIRFSIIDGKICLNIDGNDLLYQEIKGEN